MVDDLPKYLVVPHETPGTGAPTKLPAGLVRFLGYVIGGEEDAEALNEKGREMEAARALAKLELERDAWRWCSGEVDILVLCIQ